MIMFSNGHKVLKRRQSEEISERLYFKFKTNKIAAAMAAAGNKTRTLTIPAKTGWSVAWHPLKTATKEPILPLARRYEG